MVSLRQEIRYHKVGETEDPEEVTVYLYRDSSQAVVRERFREICLRVLSSVILLAVATGFVLYELKFGSLEPPAQPQRLPGQLYHSWVNSSHPPDPIVPSGEEAKHHHEGLNLNTEAEHTEHQPETHSHGAGIYHHGVVITDSEVCSDIAKGTLQSGGNVLDAGVAAAFCLSVVHPHAVPGRREGHCHTLDAMSCLTAGSTGGVFSSIYYNGTSGMSSVMNAIPHEASHMPYGIPLLPQGLWLLHQKHGLTMWSELLDPAIKLANTGYMVDSVLASAIETNREKVQSSLGLSSLYFFANGTMKSRENKILNPQLGKVLLQIANQMSDALLPADLIQNFSSDIDSSQSPTFNQMLYKKYLNIESPVTIHLPGMTMLTPPAPSAGQILSDLIWEMNSQKPLENTSKDHSINRAYSVLLNASKMTYASHGFKPSNSSHQASTSWDPAPAGANVLIANSHGDIFVMSISLNSSFGSGFVSPSTGILMNDFIHGPESPSASTPIFWASPTVVIIAGTDNDIVGLVASGASSLPFALGQVILNHVYLMNDLTVSVSGPLVDLTSGSSDPWLEYLGIWGKKPDSERRPEDYSCSTVAVGVEAEHVHVAKSPGLCCYYRGI